MVKRLNQTQPLSKKGHKNLQVWKPLEEGVVIAPPQSFCIYRDVHLGPVCGRQAKEETCGRKGHSEKVCTQCPCTAARV
ncbi:unnamed protein product [Paramecium pentaurelia]|uniref:Uncharacterized protein n=1 Tax=Paramecium pentaurelia TaxID=43138 RepID=A0A8S1WZE2_9CILI|nr:unnamed protein product [Paramecium pentaurelia]